MSERKTQAKTRPQITLLTSKDTGQAERVKHMRNTYAQLNIQPTNGLPADFMWFAHGKKLGIELKVAGDLLGSLGGKKGSRLGGQVRKMLEQLDFSLLLWCARTEMDKATGKLWMNGQETNWDYRSVMGMLADLMMLGMAVEVWDGPVDERVAAWVVNTCKEDHSWLRNRTRPEEVWSLDPAYSNGVWALCAHDGIGPEVAQEMLKKWGPAVSMVYTIAGEYHREHKLMETQRDKNKVITRFCKDVKGLGPGRAVSFLQEVAGA